jgi:WD40 repeat protein
MKLLKPLLPAALFGLAVLALAGITAVGAEPRADWPQADQDASKSEPAKPEETPEMGAGENGRDELDQLLEEAEKERLAYSPDKKLLAHLGRRLVTVWSVGERRQLHRFVLEGRVLTAAFSPDGGSLVTADGEGNLEYRSTIKLWSLATGESRLIAQFLGSPTHFSFSPDGSRLAATSILGIIGSITRNPEDGNAGERIQTGGSIHVWRVSDGRELLKVDIELPEYSAKLMQFWRAQADDPDFNKDKAAGNALQAAYYEAVRKRVPYRLNFSPDGRRLIAVSKSGQETIIDSRTGKPLRPTSRGEQDGADQPATAPESKSKGVRREPEQKCRKAN